jgi:CheY-like chemotaxis protein
VHRILVVDDEPDIHIFVGRVLTDAGYDVEVALNGREALDRIDAHRPDLVLLDLMMPELDGWGVLAHLRQVDSPPPVVILTAHGDFEAFARGMRERVVAFIAKPFHFGDLLETCHKVLDNPMRDVPVELERRKEERRHLMVGVRALSRDGVPLALGELVDMSPGGARARLPVQLNAGDRVRLALHISLDDVPLHLAGEVKWCAGQREAFYHGLAFVGLSPRASETLNNLFSPPDAQAAG